MNPLSKHIVAASDAISAVARCMGADAESRLYALRQLSAQAQQRASELEAQLKERKAVANG